jgi:hypothetical protein
LHPVAGKQKKGLYQKSKILIQPLFYGMPLLLFCNTTHTKAASIDVVVVAGVHAAAVKVQTARGVRIVVRTVPIVAVATDNVQHPVTVVAPSGSRQKKHWKKRVKITPKRSGS